MKSEKNRSGNGILFRVLFLVFLVFFTGWNLSAVQEISAAPKSKKTVSEIKQPTPEMHNISSMLIRLVIAQHYAGKKMTPELSEMIFNDYLKHIDPLKMFFLQSEVDELAKKKFELGRLLVKGDVSFAFDTFNFLLTRMKEYRAFAEEYLKSNPSLLTDEEYRLDHDKAPWPATKEEMKDFWRKKLLHELIMANMADRADAEESKEKSGEEKKEENAEAITKPAVKPPAVRIARRIADMVKVYEEMEPFEVLEIYLTSVTQVFDPHSTYMSPRSNDEFEMDMSLSLVGIGAVLTQEDGYTKIIEIMPGGPAEKSGVLKSGDRIIAVQQEGEEPVDVIDMPLNKVVNRIRGKENTKVTLTYLPAGQGMSNPKKITIVREKIELKESAAKGEIREWNGMRVGVISLPSFYLDFDAAKKGIPDYRSATNDVRRILMDFRKQNIDALVMDLRSNGGGSLSEAIRLTGLFIADGPVVQVRGKQDTVVQNDEDDGEIVYDGPMAVMINRFSASSSEIFAAAIRDYNRGILTGDVKSHGKGTVQEILDLDRYMPFLVGRRFPAGATKLTKGKFYRINGESTQLKGIATDIPFPSVTDYMDTGEDKLDHPLPWDTIPATIFQKYSGKYALTDDLRAKLSERSRNRIADSKDFALLKKNLEEYGKFKDRKAIALNIDIRWAEYQKQKQLQKEEEALFESRSHSSKDKKKKMKDLYLEETMNVLRDLKQEADGNPREIVK